MRLAGKTAIVTGAAMGIGAGAARRLAAEGAHVAIFDLNEEASGEVVADIAAAGGSAFAVACDVAQSTSVKAAVDTVVERCGGIDVLVNCAGIVRYGTVVEMPEEEWDLQIDVNLKGTFLVSKYAIPHMGRGGAIVNTASVQAFATQPGVAAYSAAKGGVVAMTKTMALDHASAGIRVNVICPGSVETPMLRQAAEGFSPDDPRGAMDKWGQGHPLGFLAQPADVAAVIAFLASDDAKLVTGAPILVDQGLLARVAL